MFGLLAKSTTSCYLKDENKGRHFGVVEWSWHSFEGTFKAKQIEIKSPEVEICCFVIDLNISENATVAQI